MDLSNVNITHERMYPLPFANSSLFPMLLLSLANQKIAPKISTSFKKEYDYIVVGGGSEGSVVADRLSELPCVNVLLLEAGQNPPLVSDIPAVSRYFYLSDIDWRYLTTPQKHTGNALNNRQVYWPAGKVLGGISIYNDLIYSRGAMSVYDEWEKQGCKGWSAKDVFPYFMKLEDNRDPEYLANGYHSRGGPVTIEKPRYDSIIKEPIFESAKMFGYKVVDPNTPTTSGFYHFQGTLRNAQRCSPPKAYLVPAENRTNLDIVTSAYVKKIMIEGNRATGVVVDYGGSEHIIKAKREVIVSAGTAKTPQLLMLSGIGPKDHLQELNIPVVADLPVGNNLQAFAIAPLNYQINNPHLQQTVEQRLADDSNIEEYIHNRTGILASAEIISVISFLNDLNATNPYDFPYYEMYFLEFPKLVPKNQTNFKPGVFEEIYGPYKDTPIFLCGAMPTQPKSKGTVRLQSTDPYVQPLIDPNYFADPLDVRSVVAGLKTCQQILLTEPLRKVGARAFDKPNPGCTDLVNEGDKYYECIARGAVLPISHAVGTAKMGDPNDPTTVVDPLLNVKGVKGLRIVDGSAIPIIPSANSNIPEIMLAEKASDLIKQTVQCPAA
ncbi:glucose dehydrogenase [FAD, quinone]-like [Argiope bruennichi]|uniref:glucose dehydrogenase [FAD, quinone]-like n=1 Tax=Argiope bruennichi TaxID=94029 RepID=UPI00249551D7|nr:glucose dehydrogenase [FAD, quinone]-like [Argiope bruennichi]